jgi:hypothetical protein
VRRPQGRWRRREGWLTVIITHKKLHVYAVVNQVLSAAPSALGKLNRGITVVKRTLVIACALSLKRLRLPCRRLDLAKDEAAISRKYYY